MVDIEYANAYSEVLEILKYIPIEDYDKTRATSLEKEILLKHLQIMTMLFAMTLPKH